MLLTQFFSRSHVYTRKILKLKKFRRKFDVELLKLFMEILCDETEDFKFPLAFKFEATKAHENSFLLEWKLNINQHHLVIKCCAVFICWVRGIDLVVVASQQKKQLLTLNVKVDR